MARRSQIIGVPRLRRKLARINPDAREEIADVIDETSTALLADMKAHVPVSADPGPQGHLRDALTMRIAKNQLSGRVGLVTPTLQRRHPYWVYLEFGTIKMAARPFAVPAIVRAEASYALRIRQAVDVALQRASRG